MNEKTLARMQQVADELRSRAARMVWDGRTAWRGKIIIAWEDFLKRSIVDVPEVYSRVMFSRDIGHHTSGWLKNPDYERCWHLSVSAVEPKYPLPTILTPRDASTIVVPGKGVVKQSDLDADVEAAWVKCFFGDAARYVWRESAKSEQGRAKNVWHYRVFADEAWQPIVPRGEVYSTELTEQGWKSWSELYAEGKGPLVVSTVDPS